MTRQNNTQWVEKMKSMIPNIDIDYGYKPAMASLEKLLKGMKQINATLTEHDELHIKIGLLKSHINFDNKKYMSTPLPAEAIQGAAMTALFVNSLGVTVNCQEELEEFNIKVFDAAYKPNRLQDYIFKLGVKEFDDSHLHSIKEIISTPLH